MIINSSIPRDAEFGGYGMSDMMKALEALKSGGDIHQAVYGEPDPGPAVDPVDDSELEGMESEQDSSGQESIESESDQAGEEAKPEGE
jgi:hypothetical protein